jgi:hypothetical protein
MFRNILTGLMLVLSLVACGQEITKRVDYADQGAIVQAFIDEAAIRGVTVRIDDLKIEYAHFDPTDGAYGQCDISGGHSTITLNIDAWETRTSSEKEATLFHELGHCVFKMQHELGYSSIMSAHALMDDYYVQNRTSLLDEFFSHAQ